MDVRCRVREGVLVCIIQSTRSRITLYCHSLFHIPSNNLHSTHNCLLCKYPGNESYICTPCIRCISVYNPTNVITVTCTTYTCTCTLTHVRLTLTHVHLHMYDLHLHMYTYTCTPYTYTCTLTHVRLTLALQSMSYLL